MPQFKQDYPESTVDFEGEIKEGTRHLIMGQDITMPSLLGFVPLATHIIFGIATSTVLLWFVFSQGFERS